MVRWRLASQPINGQVPTSFLAMKVSGATLPITGMSSQEMWLATRRSGRSSLISPITSTRTFRTRQNSGDRTPRPQRTLRIFSASISRISRKIGGDRNDQNDQNEHHAQMTRHAQPSPSLSGTP